MDVSWSQLNAAGAAYDKQDAPQSIAGTTAESPQGFDFVGAATMGIVMLCDFVGQPQRWGEHWKTTPKEAQNFAEAIDKVMPDDFSVGKWGAFAIAAGAFAAPRVALTVMQKNQKQKPQQEKPTQQNAAKPVPAIEHVPQQKQKAPAQAESSRS